MKSLKSNLQSLESNLLSSIQTNEFDRPAFENVLKKQFFFSESHEKQGYSSGLVDYGPPGFNIKQNLLNLFRKRFIKNGPVATDEISIPTLVPYDVLRVSGHVQKFHDYFVTDKKTNTMHRADHLLEENGFENTEKMNKYEMEQALASLKNYNLTPMREFNLMFKTSLIENYDRKTTPLHHVMFLRPETAQGIFQNFLRMHSNINLTRLPFGACHIGKAFRNEVKANSSKLIRLREFTMAEIEIFFIQNDIFKAAEWLKQIKPLKMLVWTKADQLAGKTPSLRSIDESITSNSIQAVYLNKIGHFLEEIGLDLTRVRLRQHGDFEMAHYAKDCWDFEVQLADNSWLECVGCANRGDYDLKNHALKTGAFGQYTVQNREASEASHKIHVLRLKKHFDEGISKNLIKWARAVDRDKKIDLSRKVFCPVKGIEKEIDLGVYFEKVEKITNVLEKVVLPEVIEPSFGVDRLIQGVLEHNFKQRKSNKARGFFTFPNSISPYKVGVVLAYQNEIYSELTENILSKLRAAEIDFRWIDNQSVMSKKYIEMDELGVPYVLTIDKRSLEDQTVTIRNRDTLEQVRIEIENISKIINSLIQEDVTFDDLIENYGLFNS